jgi:hypothetical protein
VSVTYNYFLSSDQKLKEKGVETEKGKETGTKADTDKDG